LEVVAEAIYPLNFYSGSSTCRCSVDYFNKNSERNISVEMQVLSSAI